MSVPVPSNKGLFSYGTRFTISGGNSSVKGFAVCVSGIGFFPQLNRVIVIIRIVAVIVVVWAISFTFITDAIINKIKIDLLPKGAHIIYQYPLEPLILKLKISLYLGIAASLPYIAKVVYETLKSRTDLLNNFNVSKSKWISYLIVSVILFCLGLSYGYFIMLPIFLQFLYQLAVQQGALAYYSIAEFVTFVVLMLVVFGFVFELPLVLYILVSNNVINYSTLKYYRSCLLYTSPSPRDLSTSRMPSSA